MAGSRSLTLAVRDQLMQPAPPNNATSYAGYGLGLTAAQCAVTFNGKPNPDCGPLFFAVHHGARNNQSLNADLSYYSVEVTISARANQSFDRIGPNLVDWANGVMAWADRVFACVFANQWGVDPIGIMNRADEYLPPGSHRWKEALYPLSETQASMVRAEWFSATEEQQTKQQNRGGAMPFVGLSVDVSLVGAMRPQNLTDMGA